MDPFKSPLDSGKRGPLYVVLKLDIVTGGERFSKGTVFEATSIKYRPGGFVATVGKGFFFDVSDNVAYVERWPGR